MTVLASSSRKVSIERGVSPIVFFTLYVVTRTVMGLLALSATGKLAAFPNELRTLGQDWAWLVVAFFHSRLTLLFFTP